MHKILLLSFMILNIFTQFKNKQQCFRWKCKCVTKIPDDSDDGGCINEKNSDCLDKGAVCLLRRFKCDFFYDGDIVNDCMKAD
jgi:hypothetical protein